MATMAGLADLVNSLQSACAKLSDSGEDAMLHNLWESLPSVVVIGGQGSGKSSVLESIVGRDFLPRGSGTVTRRPLLLHLHRTDRREEEFAEFLHLPGRRFTDYSMVRKEIQEETDKVAGRSKKISSVPIQLRISSPHVVNLTMVDLPGLMKVAIDGQQDTTVQDIENLVRSYVKKKNSLILAVTPANQDIATSDAIKLAREVDQSGERTYGVITKLDLMDKGTDALEVLEGTSYRLPHPWVGVVNRSQADIYRNMDILAARRKEREFFSTTPEYAHLANKMGSLYLAKLLSTQFETLIRSQMVRIMSSINRNIVDLDAELDNLGRSAPMDASAKLYKILELCRAFHRTFEEYLDGGRPGGAGIYRVFDYELPTNIRRLPLDRHLSAHNVRKLVMEADGYQPHLIAPELAYRRLIDGAINYFRDPAEASVNAVHRILKDLVRKSIGDTEELKCFPLLQSEIATAAYATLERFRAESKKTTLRLVDMETSYLTVDFFRELTHEPSPAPAKTPLNQYPEGYYHKIASNVSSYVAMVADTLRKRIPKAIVLCQVKEAKHSLLDCFYTQLGTKQDKEMGQLLNEDPVLAERRTKCKKRLEVYKSARDEISSLVCA